MDRRGGQVTRAIDWSLLGEDGFWVAERAARSVARSFSRVEEEDVFQEACIYIATHPDFVRQWYEYGEALPGVRGGRDGGRKRVLVGVVHELRRMCAADLGADLNVAGASGARPPAPDLTRWGARPTPPGYEGLGYTPAIVERLLPALWGDLDTVRDPQGPTEDMPRAKADPSHAGSNVVHLADVRRAWELVDLPLTERQALFATAVLGLTAREAAAELGAGKSTVIERADRALTAILTTLNGKEVPLTGTVQE